MLEIDVLALTISTNGILKMTESPLMERVRPVEVEIDYHKDFYKI